MLLLFICTVQVVVYIYGAGSAPENWCLKCRLFGGQFSALSPNNTLGVKNTAVQLTV